MATRRPRAAVGLTRKDVVDGALALIDEVGLDAFSVRELARRLGVYPTAVHWHAGTRTELVALVVSELLRDLVVPACADWEDHLRSSAVALRATLHAHPAVVPAFVSQVANATPAVPVVDQMLARLEDAGLRGAELREVYNALIGAVAGFVGVELAQPPRDEEWAAGFRAELDGIDAQAYPALARNLPELRDRAFLVRWSGGRTRPMDAAFATLLDLLMTGVRARH